VVVAILWQGFALYGPFPPKLFPTVDKILSALVRLMASGVLPVHAASTLLRLTAGFLMGAVLGVALGLAMGRSRRAEDLLLPIVSVGNPIPGLAYAPLFVLWFGLGDLARRPPRRLRRGLPGGRQHVDGGAGGEGHLDPRRPGHGRR
jgi:ABC-type nitrate/sulfonate/bicarbonate transport system permease component